MSTYLRGAGQVLSVVAIALGMGLLVAGASVSPAARGESMARIVQAMQISPGEAEVYRRATIALNGTGAAFLTFGILGLLVPWVNVWAYGRLTDADDSIEPMDAA